MEARFSVKIKTAAVAAWWSILIAFLFILFQWLFFLYFNAHPQGLISVLLGGFDWQHIRIIWLWSMAVLKLCLLLLLFVTIWLTLWARGLAKNNS